MGRLARLSRDTTASVSVEMALLVPMLIVLLFGGLEGANFLWRQHTVVMGVRDGARYAGRLPFGAYDCAGGSVVNSPTAYADQIGNVTRTGIVDATASTPVRVPLWTSNAAPLITIAVTCDPSHNTGIYNDVSTGAPQVTVRADVPYRSLFSSLGFATGGLRLRASSQSLVMGV